MNEKKTITHASLCSGIGGAELAASWMGWRNIFHCEINEFCRTVLAYHYPHSVSYEDITNTDFTAWRESIDVLTAGFPCQPFSLAGKRAGANDNRYLWPQIIRAIREVRPAWFVGENVAGLLSMVQPGSEIELGRSPALFEESYRTRTEQLFTIEAICQDLEHAHYSVQPFVIPACAVGAPHRRDRIWIVAHRTDAGFEGKQGWEVNTDEPHAPADPESNGQQDWNAKGEQDIQSRRRLETFCRKASWADFPTQSLVCNGNDGLPFDISYLTLPFAQWRSKSIEALGNAWVPQVAYEIFKAIELSNV